MDLLPWPNSWIMPAMAASYPIFLDVHQLTSLRTFCGAGREGQRHAAVTAGELVPVSALDDHLATLGDRVAHVTALSSRVTPRGVSQSCA